MKWHDLKFFTSYSVVFNKIVSWKLTLCTLSLLLSSKICSKLHNAFFEWKINKGILFTFQMCTHMPLISQFSKVMNQLSQLTVQVHQSSTGFQWSQIEKKKSSSSHLWLFKVYPLDTKSPIFPSYAYLSAHEFPWSLCLNSDNKILLVVRGRQETQGTVMKQGLGILLEVRKDLKQQPEGPLIL